MNQSQLIEELAKSTGSTKADAKKFLNAFKEVVSSNVEKEDIKIFKFGKFYLHHRKMRKGRNPKTGESLVIPSKLIVKFKASDSL